MPTKRNEHMAKCEICASTTWHPVYEGQIRVGRFGQSSESEHTVWKCEGCGVGCLGMPSVDYEGAEYRCMVNGDDSPEKHRELHAQEQQGKLDMVGLDKVKGSVVADIGAGAGLFLDLVRSRGAETTVGVEPSLRLRGEMGRSGHHAYAYCSDALKDWKGKVDLVTMFAVIEHVQDPVGLLRDAREFLKRDGCCVLSTPNADDWLIEALPSDYARFFYRRVHEWYFNGSSLTALAQRVGFSKLDIRYLQRFDVSNALLWLRDRRPTGIGRLSGFDKTTEAYHKEVEQQGRSDFIYAWFSC